MTKSKIIYYRADFESNCPLCVRTKNFEHMKIRQGQWIFTIDGSGESFCHAWHLHRPTPSRAETKKDEERSKMLTLREKFIAHFVAINIVGTLDDQPKEAIEGTVEKMLLTRLRGLSEREVDEIIEQLADEFLVSGNLSNTLDKIKKSKVKRNDWREELR
jgi:hypothetical protein